MEISVTKVIPSWRLGEAVCKALGLDETRVARIVIDIDCLNANAVPVYVEMLGTEGLLGVDWTAVDFEIVGTGKNT